MRTKPFNLERALAGDPVVTKSGMRVLSIEKRKDSPSYVLLANFKQGLSITYTKEGYQYNENHPYYRLNIEKDLFMLVTEPQEGDLVEVRALTTTQWRKRIFLHTIKNGLHLTVHNDEEKDYYNNEPFSAVAWKYMRSIETKPSISIDIKINGKDAKLSDLSEETLLNLRKEN